MPPHVLALAPASVRLVTDADSLDFLHCDAVHVAAPLSVFQAYCAMTSEIPGWLAAAFRARDFISRWFNVVDIHGFSPRSPNQVPAVGELLDFFVVEALSDNQMVLTSRDAHLAVMVCMDLTPVRESVLRLSVTTSVQHFNTFGRLYMVPVGPAHGPIVKRMLRNAVVAFPI
jgi:hypothetical protein